MGNKGVIASRDVQWMTAGSGIIHQEMPKGDYMGFSAMGQSPGFAGDDEVAVS
jgi:redox-sensitive bicupin YhaK (pirin superfamily)